MKYLRGLSGNGIDDVSKSKHGKLSDEEALAVVKSPIFNGSWKNDYNADLVEDLRNRVYWSGNFLTDYLFSVRQKHPLWSCFFCHPAHPYNKIERVAVFVFITACTFPSTSFVRWFTQGREPYAPATLWIKFWVLFGITIPLMILQMMIETLVQVDSRSCKNSSGLLYCCGVCCEIMSAGTVCWMFAVSVGITVMSAVLLQHHGELVQPFFMSRLLSWVLWHPKNLFMPMTGFYWKHREESRKNGLAEEASPLNGKGDGPDPPLQDQMLAA